jgi:hypothetical protein
LDELTAIFGFELALAQNHSADGLEHFPRKWIPIRRKEVRQMKGNWRAFGLRPLKKWCQTRARRR